MYSRKALMVVEKEDYTEMLNFERQRSICDVCDGIDYLMFKEQAGRP